MSELPSPSLTEMSTSESLTTQNTAPEPHPAQRGKNRFILIGGAIIVGVGALCGLGYAAWAGYLPNPLMNRPTPEQFFTALTTIKSTETTIDVHLALEAQESDVEPIDFSLFEGQSNEEGGYLISTLAETSKMLPSDLDFNLSVTSSFTRENEKADQETHIAGTYTGNNISANIDLTTRTVGGVTYVKPDAIPLPIPLFDMSVLEGKWINLDTASDDREVFEYTSISEDFDEEIVKENEEEEVVDLQIELFTLLKQGVSDGAIIFSVPERVTYNKERAWYTEAVIDGEKFRETVINIGENRKTLFPNVTEYSLFTDEFLESSAKERAKDIYKEMFKRMELSATINDDGSPLMIAFSTRLAPKLEEDILKDRQITFETEIHFNSINTPITLTAPEDAISTDKAIGLLMGTDTKKDLADEQRTSISDIQSALSIYMQEKNEYPETLEMLIGVQDEYKKVIQIPIDILTEKIYEYETTESGYTLRYTMPEAVNDEFSFYDLTVEGVNTATELFFSEEGAKLEDYDEDGVSAYDEAVTYGTSDYLNDSDFDGFDDKSEIDGGYNPNGEGVLVTTE